MLTIVLIAVSVWLGVCLGGWLMTKSINYLISREVMDVYYKGKRAEVFRMW